MLSAKKITVRIGAAKGNAVYVVELNRILVFTECKIYKFIAFIRASDYARWTLNVIFIKRILGGNNS